MPKASGTWFESVSVKGGEYAGCARPGGTQAAKNATRHVNQRHVNQETDIRCFMMPPGRYDGMKIVWNF
ncbi:hypothetical protein NWI01_16520 [Nitrobacter winogradskyi]|uniref:Uncharacterized protein n=1 Tax=Nitrobacter winogradskyi TaxID=913 RepID=A0A4Y3WCI4_NITWI|nr:hypothetical protein NWI01_16520 [Nitrobacter winogradskyi]